MPCACVVSPRRRHSHTSRSAFQISVLPVTRVSKKASRSDSSRLRLQGSALPECDSGLVGTDDGGWTGALGRTGECDEPRRDVGCEKDWFMAAREESAGWSALLFAGCWAAGSFWMEEFVLETQQPWGEGVIRLRHEETATCRGCDTADVDHMYHEIRSAPRMRLAIAWCFTRFGGEGRRLVKSGCSREGANKLG